MAFALDALQEDFTAHLRQRALNGVAGLTSVRGQVARFRAVAEHTIEAMQVARTLDAGSGAEIAHRVGLHGTRRARFTFHARVERFTAEVVTRTRRRLNQNATVGSWIAAATANAAVTNTAVETGELTEIARLTAVLVAVAEETVRTAF